MCVVGGIATLARSSGPAAWAQCEIDKLLASGGSSGDFFGTEVDISGDTAIVGGFFSSAAYVYRMNGTTWVEEAVLVPDDVTPLDIFGKTVAIRDGVAVVGAPGDDESGGFAAGAAYVFRLQPGSSTWMLETKLLASDGEAGDYFGWSVAVSGEAAVIGAWADNDVSGDIAGAAYVFRFDGSKWTNEAKLVADGDLGGDDFLGFSVDMDGDVIIAGAPGDEENGDDSGSAYIFRYDGARWIQAAELLDPDGAPGDNLGFAVAIDGETAAVGSPGDDVGGSALVFRFDGSSWAEEAKLFSRDGEPETFGDSVDVDADVLVVGAPSDNNENGINAGAAYVFRFDGATWLEKAVLTTSDGASFDNLATWVVIGGDTAILGADGDDDNGGDSGSAYVFAGLNGVDCNANGTSDACDVVDGVSTDADGNGVPDECDCPWDLDGDGQVGAADLRSLLANWGGGTIDAPDFGGDGFVDITDLLTLLSNWGPCS